MPQLIFLRIQGPLNYPLQPLLYLLRFGLINPSGKSSCKNDRNGHIFILRPPSWTLSSPILASSISTSKYTSNSHHKNNFRSRSSRLNSLKTLPYWRVRSNTKICCRRSKSTAETALQKKWSKVSKRRGTGLKIFCCRNEEPTENRQLVTKMGEKWVIRACSHQLCIDTRTIVLFQETAGRKHALRMESQKIGE